MKKNILSTIMVCSIALTAVASPSIALADSVDVQIKQQDEKINALKGQQEKAQAEINALESKVASVNEKVSSLEAKQAKLSQDTEKLQSEIATLKVRIAKREKSIQKQARDAQTNGQSTNYVNAVLEADSLSDAISRVHAMSTIVNANNDLVKQQKRDQQSVEENIQENEAKISEMASTQKELQSQKDSLASQQAELNVLKTTLAAEQATAEGDKAKLNKQKEEAKAAQIKVLKAQQEASEKPVAVKAVKAEKTVDEKKTETTTQNSTSSSSEQSSSTVQESKPVEKPTTETTTSSSETTTSSNETPSSTPSGNTTSNGSGVDHSGSGNMYAVGQCTWYVKSVAPWVGTYWGNGCQWGASAAADGYTVNSTPAAGAVVVFAAGQSVGGQWTADGSYGHVAYVDSYNASNNTITISQGGTGFSSPTGPNSQTISASGYTYIHR
ncbi:MULTISPECIES: CHAP domain-containing protein [Enterococcaceae]|uniref:CHAP domain-containing protein n=1 Tax=Enterococcaceae TaxID=81852 RepID=UPI000E4AC920|nr:MULTISPECIES: CHAP domain-containing protein [Enterococcaceae]MCI0131142.1 CHAP domain-containing protein [Vagococcus sp. CY53-2]RGI29749.1 CHAP domain-containing protein [Melissococcus sp. OM08-11BH]UNM89637.1 CHAP domain-containing protein [Vagococcus sp. CY52-2]